MVKSQEMLDFGFKPKILEAILDIRSIVGGEDATASEIPQKEPKTMQPQNHETIA